VALANTIAAFDTATMKEARRRRMKEMAEQWRAERQRPHIERDLQYRERREGIEQRRREAVERQHR
jgi:hypothetical protein